MRKVIFSRAGTGGVARESRTDTLKLAKLTSARYSELAKLVSQRLQGNGDVRRRLLQRGLVRDLRWEERNGAVDAVARQQVHLFSP